MERSGGNCRTFWELNLCVMLNPTERRFIRFANRFRAGADVPILNHLPDRSIRWNTTVMLLRFLTQKPLHHFYYLRKEDSLSQSTALVSITWMTAYSNIYGQTRMKSGIYASLASDWKQNLCIVFIPLETNGSVNYSTVVIGLQASQ